MTRAAILARMWQHWHANPHATLGHVAGRALTDAGHPPTAIRWLLTGRTKPDTIPAQPSDHEVTG